MEIEKLIFKHISRQIELRNSVHEMEAKTVQKEPQKEKNRLQAVSIIGLSVAACLAFVLFVAPWRDVVDVLPNNNIERPTLADYRAASPSSVEIDEAIEHKDYERALKIIDETLVSSAQALAQFAKSAEFDDEALLYEKDLEAAHNYQLRWMRIYALTSLAKNDEAIRDLEFFITLEGEHRQEASRLLNKLKE